MKLPKHIKARLFQWSHVLSALAALLPFLVLCVLGILWLFEHDSFFVFMLVTALIGIAIVLLNKVLLHPKRLNRSTFNPSDLDIAPNPEWSARETQLFNNTCQSIQTQTAQILDWERMPKHALDVVQQVAVSMGGNKSKPLGFSAPEALLLIEQTAQRYRKHLRQKVPFTDQVSIAQIYWLWRNRKSLSTVWKFADGGRRLARFATNPSGALVKELELLMSGEQTQYVSDQLMSTLQTLLLEEVAAAAIDLYSGRLRFSEQELLQVELASAKRDQAARAQPDDPLRIMITGQISSGKSSFINHLINADFAEIDAAPTTSAFTTYEGLLDGVPCTLVDSPGISGEDKVQKALLQELTDSDMVVWLVRGDRPSRSADTRLLALLNAWYQERPSQRMAPIIPVVTHIDRLVAGWPFPEHELPPDAEALVDRVVDAVARDMDGLEPIPISNSAPSWNLERVYERLGGYILEASMTQKNRKRLAGEKASRSMKENARRGAKGVAQGIRTIGAKWLSKAKDKSDD